PFHIQHAVSPEVSSLSLHDALPISCPMCAGAILQSRMKRVVFGAFDPKAGCAGTLMNFLEDERFNHQVEVTSGVLEENCAKLLRSEEHTSELQSRFDLVCRLLREKK